MSTPEPTILVYLRPSLKFCLLEPTVTFKDLRSYRDGTFDQCTATL